MRARRCFKSWTFRVLPDSPYDPGLTRSFAPKSAKNYPREPDESRRFFEISPRRVFFFGGKGSSVGSSCVASGSLFGRPVVLSLFGELLQLPCVDVDHPFPALLGRWADPRVVGNTAVTQGLHVRAIKFDPRA